MIPKLMAGKEFESGSPDERLATVYLEHVAGFETAGVDGNTVFVTTKDLEKDADGNPIDLRGVLRGEHSEVAELSNEYLLRNLVLPNLPVGFYGDKEYPPVILGAATHVREPDSTADSLEYAKHRNTVSVEFTPTKGRLSHVSVIREPRLGGYGIDWLTADRKSCSASLFGGTLDVKINFDQPSSEGATPTSRKA